VQFLPNLRVSVAHDDRKRGRPQIGRKARGIFQVSFEISLTLFNYVLVAKETEFLN